MSVRELNRDQLTELKGNYMVQLVNEGTFAEVMNRGYDEPDWDDMANADDYVSDDVVFDVYDGIDFGTNDFFCMAGEV